MAKQRGIFKAEGTIDEVTFYKSKDGYLIRQKGAYLRSAWQATRHLKEREKTNRNFREQARREKC